MSYSGWWNDGLSAQRYAVRVRLMGRRLVVTDGERDRPVVEWSLEGLSLAEEVYQGQPIRFLHRDFPDARLIVEDSGLLERIAPLAPKIARRYHGKSGPGRRVVLWGGAFLAVVLAVVLGMPFAARVLVHHIPAEWEVGLGEAVMDSFLTGRDQCTAPEGMAALGDLTARLEAVADAPYPFVVKVVDDSMVNAFAAPGGQIVLMRGLIDEAESADEVAGVLAHEMAHGVLRHPTRGLLRRVGYRVTFAALFGDASTAVLLVSQAGEMLLNLSHSREDEAEADALGLAMLNDAGIDSRGLEAFFTRLQAESDADAEYFALLSSHPLHSARVESARQLSRSGEPALGPEQWGALQRICED
ncbi:hypothetical protein CAI21_15240 [Alkalilimnicola ehrlichii]|uniref:Uncharacterized protein n=1 Tax=Alkalilimnicola ehrlichii TaxID=351052 RepID=A0A3E0WT52_9GAMM|nr:M48 family metallopeptidase [Alkalilimnicola ehrlichii]RFA27200.1 hypothetical protein CAI21_15240 [Alkalilimnicola ehrlichii]RFA35373.1 hypothetical protein CAL65_12900 [Alkalilimnicola ehrlichii]